MNSIENQEPEFSNLKIISKFKVFTEYEFISAINCFETNFEELSWALENLQGLELYSALLRIKMEYHVRYLDKGAFDKYSHVYKIIFYFIDMQLLNLKLSEKDLKVKNKLPIFFEDILINRKIAIKIIEALLEKNLIIKGSNQFIWHSSNKGTGKEIAHLFRYLCEKNFIKEDFKKDYARISLVFYEKFGIKKSPKTYSRAFERNTQFNQRQFSFIEHYINR